MTVYDHVIMMIVDFDTGKLELLPGDSLNMRKVHSAVDQLWKSRDTASAKCTLVTGSLQESISRNIV